MHHPEAADYDEAEGKDDQLKRVLVDIVAEILALKFGDRLD